MQTIKSINKEVVVAASFLILVPLLSHFLFSWMGFTPTDEGFTLANSRRILDGQVPHRDFIIIRPFVSPLIHVPFVLFGGDYTFWLSRLFVWFQLATISWLWVSIVNRMMKFPFSVTQRVFIALISFAATAHTKHITAWNTIDGLFFIAVGLALAIRKRPAAKLFGYFLLGLSPLCKQSFIFMAPLSLIMLGDWRSPKYWLAVVSPAFCYLFFLVLTQPVSDAFVQLTSRTELVSVGLLPYTGKRLMLCVAVGYLSSRLGLGQSSLPDQAKRWIAILMLYCAPVLGTAVSLWFNILMDTSFLLFGFLFGVTIYLLTERGAATKGKQASLLVLLTAWSASLSGGYNSPALMSGPILVALIAQLFSRCKQMGERLLQYSLVLASALILPCFSIAKTRYIYRDKTAGELTYNLEGVLPGGKHIYTNQNTFAFMSDLKRAVALVAEENKEYAILPNVAAYWIQSPQKNPLPADWPHEKYELKNPTVMKRFIEALESKRNSTIFIVQKVSAATLAEGFIPLEDSDYHEVLNYIRTHFTKTQETVYFELYR
jgi:hypothetical protein